MIYTCNICHFTFERIGEIDQCPDCGKKNIREANDEEKENYIEESLNKPLPSQSKRLLIN